MKCCAPLQKKMVSQVPLQSQIEDFCSGMNLMRWRAGSQNSIDRGAMICESGETKRESLLLQHYQARLDRQAFLGFRRWSASKKSCHSLASLKLLMQGRQLMNRTL